MVAESDNIFEFGKISGKYWDWLKDGYENAGEMGKDCIWRLLMICCKKDGIAFLVMYAKCRVIGIAFLVMYAKCSVVSFGKAEINCLMISLCNIYSQ